MSAPAVAVGNRHHIVRVRKPVPDLRVVTQEVRRLPESGDEPDLLSNEHGDGDLAERKKREALLLDINGEMETGNCCGLVLRAL